MFDYLGTFTKQQLQERHSILRALIKAVPGKILHLEKEVVRVMGNVQAAEASQRFQVTNTIGSTVYELGQISHPSINDSEQSTLLIQASTSSRYPIRQDELTKTYSLGDTVFRPGAMIPHTGWTVHGKRVEQLVREDIIPAALSDVTLRPSYTLSKRQQDAEEKLKKYRYRGLRLIDEINRLKAQVETYEDELAAVESLLTDKVDVETEDGTVIESSVYSSAGVDQDWKDTDVTSERDREDLLTALYGRQTDPDSGDDAAQPNAYIQPVVPSEMVRLDIPEGSPKGNIDEFITAFPVVPRSLGTRKLQLMANIYEYGFKQGLMQPFSDSDALIRNPTGGNGTRDESALRYLPINALTDISNLSSWLKTTYDLRMRVTEAWPPTGDHTSEGHFTGNCLDFVFDARGRVQSMYPELGEHIIQYAKQQGWIQGGYNEYTHSSKNKSGPHIHLNLNVQHFNESKLFKLS